MKVQKLFEQPHSPGIFRFLDFVERSHDRVSSISSDQERHTKHKMCLYVAYLMALRDTIHTSNAKNVDLVPVARMYDSGITNCKQFIQTFGKMTEKDRAVNKRVKDNCKKLYNDNEKFRYQIEKLRNFFKRHQPTHLHEKTESGHPYSNFLTPQSINFLRKAQDDSAILKKLEDYPELVNLLKNLYNVVDFDSVRNKIKNDPNLKL